MASLTPRRRLGQILVEAGTISAEALEAALVRQKSTGEKIGEALIAMGAASRHDVLAALALQCKLPFLWSEEIPSVLPVVKNLSPKYLRQYTVCPIALEGSTVTVATADPTNLLVLDDLRQTLGLHITLCVAPPPAILEAIERTYGALHRAPEDRRGHGARGGRRRAPRRTSPSSATWPSRRPSSGSSTSSSRRPSTAEASDIHIEPFEDTLRVRYRIDGILYDQEAPPRRLQAAAHLAHQAHGGAEHRRAAPAPGRAHPRDAGRPARGHPRVDACRPSTASRS